MMGVLSLFVLWSSASGGDFFGHRCKKDCDTGCNAQVVKLPPQQIAVESVQPRVVVRESRLQVAPAFQVAPAPVVATIFTPVTLPLPGALTAADTRIEEHSAALLATHEAEHHVLAVAKARAAQKMDLEYTNRVHQRMLAALQDVADDSAAKVQVDKTSKAEIQAQLTSIANRITELEKLVILHDEVLKKLPAAEKLPHMPTVNGADR